MDVGTILAVVAMVAVGVLLLLLILVQKGRGAGLLLGASSHTLIGAKTAEAITWMTAAAFGVFLLLAALLNRLLV